MLDFLINLDGNILLYIQELIRMPAFDPFVILITSLGNAGIIWVVINIKKDAQNRIYKYDCAVWHADCK